MIFTVVNHFLNNKKKRLFFSRQSSYTYIWVGVGVELGLGLGVVSKAVFWAFFEMLEPHVGHTKFLDFYTLS